MRSVAALMASSSMPVAEEFVDVRLPHWRVLAKLSAEGRARVDELSRARKLKQMAYHSAETKSTKDEHFKQMVILGKEIVAICVGEGVLQKAVASGVSTLSTSLEEALESSRHVFKRLRTALEQVSKLREMVGADESIEPAAPEPAVVEVMGPAAAPEPAAPEPAAVEVMRPAAALEPAAAAALKPADVTSEELFVQVAALRERARLTRAEEKRRVREEEKRQKAEKKRQQALLPPSRPGRKRSAAAPSSSAAADGRLGGAPAARRKPRRSPGARKTYRKGGVSDELTEESFAAFYLAMAGEVLVRAGRLESNEHVAQLPPGARARFSSKRRCTWSWMTDRTSLALAGRLKALRGARALRAIVLASAAFTSPEAFANLCDATEGLDDEAAVKKLIVEHQEREAAKNQRTQRKSTISHGLQTGIVRRLPGPTMNDKVAAFVVKLNRTADSAWARVVGGENPVDVLVDPAGVHLPDFRAHCVARWLWVLTRGTYGESLESLSLGSGALDALQKLIGGTSEEDFARALPRLRAAVQAVDAGGLLGQLRRLGLLPDAAQTYEHLLCEAGKVFGQGRRDGRGAPRPGYKEAFDAALPLYARLVSKRRGSRL